MEKLTLRDVSDGERKNFKYALDVIEKKDPDTAIGMLKSLVQKRPAFNEARKVLFEQCKVKADKLNLFSKFLAKFKVSGHVTKGRANLVRKKAPEAFKNAVDAIALNIYDLQGVRLMADAAEAMDANFIAIEIMEAVQDNFEDNESFLRAMAALYQKNNMGLELVRIRQRISSMRPDDLDAQSELRSASAMATMEAGRWEEEGTYQDRLKDKDQSEAIEQEDRIVRSEDDVLEMLERYCARRDAGEEGIEVYRKIGDLSYKAGKFTDSIEAYNKVVELMGTLDPTIDAEIEKANVGIYKQNIAILTEQGDEDKVREMTEECYAYRLGRAEDRVQKYPNDTELRFALAEVYWEGEAIDKALEQFQLAQRNPHHRLTAIVYLGRCFAAKKQWDLSIEQFEKAVGEMAIMDKPKMDAMYHLGITYEATGKIDKAMECFKEIYQANVNYRDVKERMDAFYQKKAAEENGA